MANRWLRACDGRVGVGIYKEIEHETAQFMTGDEGKEVYEEEGGRTGRGGRERAGYHSTGLSSILQWPH